MPSLGAHVTPAGPNASERAADETAIDTAAAAATSVLDAAAIGTAADETATAKAAADDTALGTGTGTGVASTGAATDARADDLQDDRELMRAATRQAAEESAGTGYTEAPKQTDILDDLSALFSPRPASNKGKVPVTAVPVPVKKRPPVHLPGRRARIRRTAREIEEDGEAPHGPSRANRSKSSSKGPSDDKPAPIEWKEPVVFKPGGPPTGARRPVAS